ncbi:hypothetical protein LCGC14_1123540 [marine sediment metagenome]|uniref:Uncharacterized protein n=1 Tax=marine sediment metagenome TaxID=412755 RepID=A0A0F9MR38_9ZZZZ
MYGLDSKGGVRGHFHLTARPTNFADSDHWLAERFRDELRQRDVSTASDFIMGVIEDDD